MTLEQYSLLLSLGTLIVAVVTVSAGLGYAFSTAIRTRLNNVEYFNYIKIISILAIIATLGALTYQFYYETPVCELCWWQRIFMFPIDVVAIVSLLYMVRVNHVIIGTLASIGALFASYHYYYHFQIFVLGKTLSLPCGGYGLLPACTSSPILVFGFITIPLMALIVFLSILFLSFLAHKTKVIKSQRSNESTSQQPNQPINMDQQPTTETAATEPNGVVTILKKKPTATFWAGVAIAVLLVAGALAYSFKGLFVAATIDGSPISRLAVIKALEKQGGAEALDTLITEKLITKAINEQGVTVAPADVDAEIKKIDEEVTAQGGTLADALLQQGMTEEELRTRITEQKKIEVILADKATVTDEEVAAYLSDNKIAIPKGENESEFKNQVKEQLQQQKFQEAAQAWLVSLKAEAAINVYVTY